MQRKIFVTVFILFFTIIYSQSYERKWGTMIPVYNQPEKPFSPVRRVLSTPFVAEVHPKTGDLYIVSENGNEIYAYNYKESTRKFIFKIDSSNGFTLIDNIKFDSNNNLIICGKTSEPDLATPKAYIQSPSRATYGYPFVAKINPNGILNWFSYFHEIPQESNSLAIDKDNNIYILNKRPKTNVLNSMVFQATGDQNSNLINQDVITKLNPSGMHIWSTFYAKDDSKINAIVAGSHGLYVYGIHLANTSSSSYFGTSGSFLESTSNKINNTSSVFLSKFNFDGERLWSTYFGNEKSFIPYPANNIIKGSNNLVVINDNAYFISSLKKNQSKNLQNITTSGTFLEQPPLEIENHTLTKFSGDGKREWSTYLYTTGSLFASLNGNELFISTSVDEQKIKSNLLTTHNSYQFKNGGLNDIYTYIISLNGKEMKYSTFYGYEGNDTGFSLPTVNGFYTIGHSNKNFKEESLLANVESNKLTLNKEGVYVGNFLSYFEKK